MPVSLDDIAVLEDRLAKLEERLVNGVDIPERRIFASALRAAIRALKTLPVSADGYCIEPGLPLFKMRQDYGGLYKLMARPIVVLNGDGTQFIATECFAVAANAESALAAKQQKESEA